jgi:hypothetical protein
VECKHKGFHTITSSYDRKRRTLVYFRRCEECGARLDEVRRLSYEPRFVQHASERFLAVRDPAYMREEQPVER